ncbi:MAG: hypothetical protein ACK2U3_04910 [Anaerolineales bacterium]
MFRDTWQAGIPLARPEAATTTGKGKTLAERGSHPAGGALRR